MDNPEWNEQAREVQAEALLALLGLGGRAPGNWQGHDRRRVHGAASRQA